MRADLQKRCELFVANKESIREAFRWDSNYIHPLCASIFASRGIHANIEKMKECRDLLKEKTGVFSNFRGTARLATISMLSLSTDAHTKMDQMLAVYDKLKEVFFGSEFLALAAMTIADLAEPAQHGELAGRTRMIYNHMKAAHPFLTSSEDSTFAALLAISGMDDNKVAEEMERCYAILKPQFFSGNSVQSLSHVLALGEGTAEEKCRRTMELFNSLKSRGYRYGTHYELATLGVLAMLDTDVRILTEDIIEVENYLKGQKGFGAFGIGAKQRLMYAGMLTMYEYVPALQTIQTAALNGVLTLVIAQHVAICASAAAASAAAASSSSSS